MGEIGASTSDGFSLRGRLFLLEARPTYTGSTVTEVPCSGNGPWSRAGALANSHAETQRKAWEERDGGASVQPWAKQVPGRAPIPPPPAPRHTHSCAHSQVSPT